MQEREAKGGYLRGAEGGERGRCGEAKTRETKE